MSKKYEETHAFLSEAERMAEEMIGERHADHIRAIQEEVWSVIHAGVGLPDPTGHIMTEEDAIWRYVAWEEHFLGRRHE